MDQGSGSISSSNPRVDPSDWASRRKQAMSRARELRSRIKESDSSSNNNNHSDVSSLASSSKSHIKIQNQAMAKSEIQRQRRSRQLEATQKLLDGGFDFIEQSSTYPSTQAVGTSHQTSDRHETARVERCNHDEQPVGKRRASSTHTQHNNETSHSIISQKQLGQIHRRYQTPSTTTESSNSSTMKSDYHYAQQKYSTKEEDYNDKIAGNSSKSKFKSKSTFNEQEDNMIQRSVREEMPQLTGSRGRGRGRGRSRPSGSGGTSSLGELSRSRTSNRSLAHALSAAGAGVSKHEIQADSRSNSPSNTSRSYNLSRKDNGNKDFEKEQAIQSYLKSRQVPDYKEGECEKLAILRQRLVARRQKRQNALQLDRGNAYKGTQPASSSVQKPVNSKSLKEKYNSHSLERLDPNDFTAKDFQTSSSKSSKRAISSSPPRVQMQHDVRDDDIHEPTTPSMDRSHMSSSTRRSKMHADIDEDDEASVVDIQLVQCDCCKRSFAPKIYEKHFDSDGQPKCASAMDKKRPVFNSAKVRIFVHMMCLSLT